MPINAGATSLVLANETGLSVGDDLVISGDGNSEEVTISAFGTIVLAEPTVNSYRTGATVTKHWEAPSGGGTATVKDDPHVCNLNGECFDIRAGGEYNLIRAPYDLQQPDDLKLDALLDSDGVQPCGMFVKKVVLSGSWLNNRVVRIRPYTRDVGGSNWAGTRMQTNFSMQVGNSPWRSFSEKLGNAEISGVGSSMVSVRFVRREEFGKRAESQSLQFQIGSGSRSAMITVSQASHQALNLEVSNAGSLGYAALRGVLGTDDHDPTIEEASPECMKSRPVGHSRPGNDQREDELKMKKPASYRASSIGARWD